MTYTQVWIYHVLAGVIGVIASLSAFYQVIERKLSPHRHLQPNMVQSIEKPTGAAMTDVEVVQYLTHFNNLVYMGRQAPHAVTSANATNKTTVHLKTGERLEIAEPTTPEDRQFYYVVLRRQRRKPVYYRLFSTSSARPDNI